MDLATFTNYVNKAGGTTNVTGTHAFKNLTNEKKGNVIFNDHKDGQFATVGNTNNAGNMSISGLHKFENVTNKGQVTVIPRKFKPKKMMLMDLASFNQYLNKAGGNTSFTGTHQVNNLTNEKKGNVIFNDHKGGQFVVVKNTNNMGNMQISGLHQFDKFANAGNVQVKPRQFAELLI